MKESGSPKLLFKNLDLTHPSHALDRPSLPSLASAKDNLPSFTRERSRIKLLEMQTDPFKGII
jgi:hypothetical protein